MEIETKSESTYYSFFEKWLQEREYKTYSSIKLQHCEVDVVGIRHFKTIDPWIVTIEVKLNDWNTCRWQVIQRLPYADYSYMGMMMTNTNVAYFKYKLAKDLHIL